MQRQQRAKTENSQQLWDNFKSCGTPHYDVDKCQNDDAEGQVQTKKEHILQMPFREHSRKCKLMPGDKGTADRRDDQEYE